MTRVVIDTNIVVSALLNEEGNEASVLLLALQGAVHLSLSQPILSEYSDVLRRKKFSFDPIRVDRLLKLIRKAAVLSDPDESLAVCSHEPDNRLLECAQQSQARQSSVFSAPLCVEIWPTNFRPG